MKHITFCKKLFPSDCCSTAAEYLLTFHWNMQHSKVKLNPRKLCLVLFSGDTFSCHWREVGAIFSVYKPLICKGRFPHTKGDHIVSCAVTHKIKPSLLVRRVHTHPYYKIVAAASPKAGLVRCSCGRDILMYVDHRVPGEELGGFLLRKHIVHQEGKVFERHESTCCNNKK